MAKRGRPTLMEQSQKEMVKAHLETKGPIHRMEAQREYGVMNLASVVGKLNADSKRKKIVAKMITIKNNHGLETQIAEYDFRKPGRPSSKKK